MRIPFSFRLISSIVIIEVIMLSLMVWNNVRIINQSYTDFLETASRDQSALLASAIAPGLLAYDFALIEDALSVIKVKHDLIYAEVFDLNSRRIASIGKIPPNKLFTLSESYKQEVVNKIINISQAITIEGQVVGGLRVGFSTEVLRKTVDDIRLHNLILSFATITLLILVTVIISLMLTKKLNKIQEGVEQIQQGNLGYEIKVKKNDELGDLAYTFNHLAKHLGETRQQLINEQAELENRVKERTSELQQSNEALKDTIDELHKTQAQLIETEKMASLGGIVAGVAHEINTPLGISITAITSMQEDLRQLKDAFYKGEISENDFEDYIKKTEHYSSMLYGNLKTSATLISSFKKISTNNTTTDWRSINLHDYIDEIIYSIDNQIDEHDIAIENQCSADIKLHTSPGVIYQVISSLISNSLTHAFDDPEKAQITIKAIQHSDKVTIEYHDNGKGISDEHKNLIFEPFFTTRRGNKNNFGLGLSIIYNLITSTLKGKISVQSHLDEGTTFYIELPLDV